MLQDIVRNVAEDGFMEAYRDWLKDPVTQRLRDQAVRAARPAGLGEAVSGDRALYAHGVAVGRQNMHDMIFAQAEIALALNAANEAEKFLGDPDWGATKAIELAQE